MEAVDRKEYLQNATLQTKEADYLLRLGFKHLDNTLVFKSENPARPYIVRLINLSRLT